MSPEIDSARVIADLRELDRRTGGRGGARRVCWSPEWAEARAYLEQLLADLGLAPEIDEAGNLWTYLEGEQEPALAVGSHLDSVPDGGWLDGALGTMAAVGVMRSWAEADEKPPRTLALVDWADEEGCFGRSLLGSSAVTGTLDPAELLELSDRGDRSATEVLGANGVRVDQMPRARARLERIAALLELHIEQGPVLEAEGLPIAAVSGTVGIERWDFSFEGRAGHAGTTPMQGRSDAGLAAAELALAAERIAVDRDGVATTGSLQVHPGAATVIPNWADMVVDMRHGSSAELDRLLEEVRTAAGNVAEGRSCKCTSGRIWRIEPVEFDRRLVGLAREACLEVVGTDRMFRSGALHDAAEVARKLPAAMLFVRSIGGVSHSPAENSSDEDLELGIRAYADLATRALSA